VSLTTSSESPAGKRAATSASPTAARIAERAKSALGPPRTARATSTFRPKQ
jgi:hypothetical protein